MDVKDFIGKKVNYDKHGQMIFGQNGRELILDVRGWGAIHTNKEIDNPEKFQDDLGEWIADAINQKLKAKSQ
jgi:hypothetical protein